MASSGRRPGSGLIHEELPAQTGRTLHGLQVFVNLSSANKLSPPQVLRLTENEVPQVRTASGDRVRVVVGRYGGVTSPLKPVEPFTLLDVELHNEIPFALPEDHIAVVYALQGGVIVHADDHEEALSAEQAVALSGSGGHVGLKASGGGAHLLILSGRAVREPVVGRGPFIMTDQSQVDDAAARYRAGAMGYLPPLPEQRVRPQPSRRSPTAPSPPTRAR